MNQAQFNGIKQFMFERYGIDVVAQNMTEIFLDNLTSMGWNETVDSLKIDGGFCQSEIDKIQQILEDLK